MTGKISSSSPNVTKTTSSFSTLLRAAAAATSGGTDSLRGTASPMDSSRRSRFWKRLTGCASSSVVDGRRGPLLFEPSPPQIGLSRIGLSRPLALLEKAGVAQVELA